MGYDLINWQNSPNTSTPINANNLNHMDEGIKNATDATKFGYSATFTADGILKYSTRATSFGVGSFTSQKDIVTAFIANSVTAVDSGSFVGCTALKTIYVDNNRASGIIENGATESTTKVVYADDDEFINVNEFLMSAIVTLKDRVKTIEDKANSDKTELSEQIQGVKNSALEEFESLKADKLDKTDFNSYKTSNDNAVNSKVDTTDFNTYKTSTNKAIEANTTAIDKCVTDLSVSSTGYYNVDCNYKIGSIDKVTGEEKDGPAFITDKLDLSQYSNVTITTDKPTLYASVFEYDSNNKFTKVIADTKNKIIFSPVAGYKYIIWLWYGGTDFSKITEAHIKGKSINTIAENDTRYIINKEECKLDLPDNYYMQKGETLELFKYGMYLSTSEYVENKYNVRLVNMGGYVTEYSDKIVITCPADYDSDLLRKPNDLPLFQLLNNEGKVIDSKRVKIYVTDISKIHNITKNIMYLGDSLTGMGYRSAEMANLIKSTNLTNVKLIGRSIGQGTGNRFTGTGGYTWANYTENPNSLPSAYGNNYLWVNEYNNISMGHFVKYDLGESQLDYLIILLGWNDYESGAFSSSFNWEDLKTRARKLIENTHASFPSCKIILEGYHYMYPHNRQSYGNSMPQIRQNRYIYDLNKVYESLAKEYEYVIFVQMSNRIDVIHNMPMKEVTANKRNKTLVSYCTDCVHPAESGFNQYADAEFDSILYLMAKES